MRKLTMALRLISVVLVLGGLSSAAAPRGRPNIVLIITDQQHAGMLSGAGNPYLKTPSLDRLAAAGMRFELAYTANPVCLPARFSFFTGRMPSTVGIGKNGDGARGVPRQIALQAMGWLLQKAGYETVYGGKVHLPRGMALEQIGFTRLTRDQRGKLAEACVRFLQREHARPFLLVASFINPHDICYMAINDALRAQGKPPVNNVASKTLEGLLAEPRKHFSEFVQKHCPPLPPNYEVPDREPACIRQNYLRGFRLYARQRWSPEMWRLHRWAYCRLTEMVDAKIGQVLDALRDAGIEQQTLVLFTSDHGDHDGAHRLEHKQVLYEEAARVPFVMTYPGVIPAHAVDRTHLVSTGLDLLPTLCDYAGMAPPAGLLGASLRPLAEAKTVASWRDDLLVESHAGRMLRTARFKYNVYASGKDREQLVDLKDDPGEMKNLAYDERYQSVLDQHRSRLSRWMERTHDKTAQQYLIPARSPQPPSQSP